MKGLTPMHAGARFACANDCSLFVKGKPADEAKTRLYIAKLTSEQPYNIPSEAAQCFFFTVCLRTMPCLVLPSFAYTCTRFDHVYVHESVQHTPNTHLIDLQVTYLLCSVDIHMTIKESPHCTNISRFSCFEKCCLCIL